MPDAANKPVSSSVWKPVQVFVFCAVCLVAGLFVGYLLGGSAPAFTPVASPAAAPESVATVGAAGQPQTPQQMPSLDDMRHMADKKAEPLLAQLKKEPKNAELLNQIGRVYKSAHQFEEAGKYFARSLESDPKNIAVRADYASCLFFSGNVDGALVQLDKSLTYDPHHAGTLMNIGIIKWKGKNDPKGAVEAWEKVLKYHPDFPQRQMVEQMIMQAKQSGKTVTVPQKG